MKISRPRWIPLSIPFLSLSLLLLSTPTLSSQNRSVPIHAAKAPNTDEAQIRQWIADFGKAFAARDINAIMALYAPDVIAYDLVPPLQYVGKDAYRKDFEDFLAQYKGPARFRISRCTYWCGRRYRIRLLSAARQWHTQKRREDQCMVARHLRLPQDQREDG